MTTETDSRTFAEIINPSDAYTIDATDKAAACAAVLFIGEGSYGLEGEGLDMPLFIAGGLEEWWTKEFGGTFDEYVEPHRIAIADALDSVCIGGLSHRRVVEAAMAELPAEKRLAFWEKAHDEERSSMNDIGRRAKRLATRFRESALRDVASAG